MTRHLRPCGYLGTEHPSGPVPRLRLESVLELRHVLGPVWLRQESELALRHGRPVAVGLPQAYARRRPAWLQEPATLWRLDHHRREEEGLCCGYAASLPRSRRPRLGVAEAAVAWPLHSGAGSV